MTRAQRWDLQLPDSVWESIRDEPSPTWRVTKAVPAAIYDTLIAPLVAGALNTGDRLSGLQSVSSDPDDALDIIMEGIAPAAVGGVAGRLKPRAPSPEKRYTVGYPPPPRPPRPYHDDYPGAAASDAAGRLTQTIDGDPIHPDAVVVGRRGVGEADQALSPAEFDRVVETLGLTPRPGRGRELGPGVVGRYLRDDAALLFRRDLDADQVPTVLRHELGHALDDRARHVPLEGHRNALDTIYHQLNESRRWRVDATRDKTTPRHFGYETEPLVRSELIAEAIRAYLEDPNYIKTVAPKLAAEIRATINRHPELQRVIQFNAGAPPIGTEDTE